MPPAKCCEYRSRRSPSRREAGCADWLLEAGVSPRRTARADSGALTLWPLIGRSGSGRVCPGLGCLSILFDHEGREGEKRGTPAGDACRTCTFVLLQSSSRIIL